MTETDRTSVQEFVEKEFVDLGVDASAISPEATLEDLGLDSLDVVELSQAVQKKLGARVTIDDLKDARTVSQAVSVIHERLG
jgi:acyl carrier protein